MHIKTPKLRLAQSGSEVNIRNYRDVYEPLIVQQLIKQKSTHWARRSQRMRHFPKLCSLCSASCKRQFHFSCRHRYSASSIVFAVLSR